ncbi:ABC transporter permease [Kribbella sancticallisti]|uniref:ABC transporter permease n=1 Tax=Kribbella sancticallisti TaxID=460087 RepID=A0ABN2DPF3_9ACTN
MKFTVVFIQRRLVALTLLLLIVSFAVFSLLDLSPGSPEEALLGPEARTNPASVEAIREEYHLDQPLLQRYWNWLADVAHLDLGRSTESGEAVTHVIAQRFMLTTELGLFAAVIVLLIGVPVGMLAGLRRGSSFDRVVTSAAVFLASAPPFAVGILLILMFGVWLDWLPPFGVGDGVVDRLRHLVLPALALASAALAIVVRQTRAAALGVIDQDYVLFARARGLSRRTIFLNYAFHNAALPVVTTAGLLLVFSLSGAVFIETVFGLPGVGSLLIESINSRNIPVVQGLTLLTAAIVVLGNLVTDLLALALDPRTRYAGTA